MTIDNAHFESLISVKPYLIFEAINFFILVFTLGLGWSVVKVKRINYYFEHTSMVGVLDWAAIKQDAQAAGAAGEVLGDFFDVDGFGILEI